MTGKQAWTLGTRALLLILLVGTLYLWSAHRDVAELAERVQQRGAIPFFAAMTLIPLTGLPATPFYLLAGAVFGERVALSATSASTALNLALAFALTRLAPRSSVRRLEQWATRHMPNGLPKINPWLLTLLVRATPGPTIAMKSYFLGLSRVPALPYMAVSWPLSMGFAAGLILMGDSAAEGKGFGLLTGALILTAIAAFLFLFRRWAVRRLAAVPSIDREGDTP